MARRATFACPHCGAPVARGALACPECGSDADSGWSDDAEAWAGDLPAGYGDDEADETEDYEEFLRAEGLGDDRRPSRAALARRRTALICALLVACILLWMVLR